MKQKTLIIIGLGLIAASIAIDYLNFLQPLGYKTEDLFQGLLLNLTAFSFLVVFFTFSTLRSQISFSYWWRFAKYAVPITFVCVVAINFGVLHTNTYGTFGWGGMLNQMYDIWGLSLVYSVFVVGSLIQIIRGYRAGKVGGAAGASS